MGDHSMARIIGEVGEDVDQVRLNPKDYSFKVVTLEEIRTQDGAMAGSRSESRSVTGSVAAGDSGRKRKLTEITLSSDDEENRDNTMRQKQQVSNGKGKRRK